MKATLLTFALFACLYSNAQDDYILQIGDTSISMSTNKTYPIVINGKETTVRLEENDTMVFSNEIFSFKHPKEIRPSTMEIEAGIEQTIALTAEGSGFIVQSYDEINPAFLKKLMMRQLTQESVKAGYKKKTSETTRTLSDGTKLDVLHADLTYKGEVDTYEIASVSSEDEGGILILTMSIGEETAYGQDLINLMWKTIKVKN